MEIPKGNNGNTKYDLCIIGGGASGLACAIKAKQVNPDISVMIVEKMDAPGKKVAASGNGRCNLSNTKCQDWEKTSAFFSSIGLLTREEDEGRIYPYSLDGRDVVRCLVNAAENLGCEFMLRREAESIRVEDGLFQISTKFNKPKAYHEAPQDGPITVTSKNLVIATGGKSKPKLGSSGDGFNIAKSLGHRVNKLIPVLTGVDTIEDIKELGMSGVRAKAGVTLRKDGGGIFSDYGEVQFTDYGISGIVVFDMTRFMDLDEGGDFSDFEILIDFMPEFTENVIKNMIEDSSKVLGKMPREDRRVDELCSLVKRPVAIAIAKMGDEPEKHLKNFKLSPKGLRGWDMAQVTRGGIPLSEIREESGESLIVPNLYFTGEIVDFDGPCGGFNLNHAWTSGIKAGEDIAKK